MVLGTAARTDRVVRLSCFRRPSTKLCTYRLAWLAVISLNVDSPFAILGSRDSPAVLRVRCPHYTMVAQSSIEAVRPRVNQPDSDYMLTSGSARSSSGGQRAGREANHDSGRTGSTTGRQ